MIPTENPEIFLQVAERLRVNGAHGILLSGGADQNGEVPLKKFIPSIKVLKEKDPQFKVIAHTGLIQRETAKGLKEAGVDQILIDVIGDDDTIRDVYHLNKRVKDYEETLRMLKELGHCLAPHIIIGHHFGELRGEWRALEIVTRIGVETIVLVIFKALILGGENHFKIPKPEETSRISAIARILNPRIPIRMGCIRPAYPRKAEMEKGFIDSGVNTIAYPLQGTIEYAKEIGLKTKFLITLYVTIFIFLSVVSGESLCSKKAPLFRIERSKNKNIVQYDACLLQNKNISESDPIHAYWVLSNGQKEELSILESKQAYGIESKEKLGENKFRIVLAALKDRSLTVQKMKEGPKALTQISGELSILERVYVQAEEQTVGLPKVQHVDLFGRSLRTNKAVKERIIPK